MFTGDEYGDGLALIRRVLKKQNIKASFFFTGRFYRKPRFVPHIRRLIADGNYLGSHSDQHLLYCDWLKRDSLLVSQDSFRNDLQNSFKAMSRLGIEKDKARVFLPPFEWYNRTIAEWTGREGLTLVNLTHGTRSAADYTYPEMGKRYVSSSEIYESIMRRESSDIEGLNGFFLLFHVGTDARRKDKFYYQLDRLLSELRQRGYWFTTVDRMVD